MRHQKFMAIGLLLLFLLALIPSASIAQEQQEEEQQVTNPVPDNSVRISFEALGINDFAVTGFGAPISFFLPVQSNWDITQTELELTLDYVASSLIPDGSTITISASNIPVTTVPLQNDQSLQSVTVLIPADRIQDIGIPISISTFTPFTDDENPCAALRDSSQWFRIENSSSLNYLPTLRTDELRIPDVGARFLPVTLESFANADEDDSDDLNTSTEPRAILVLPDNPTPTEITTAAQVMARVGRTMRAFPFNNVDVVYAGNLTNAIRSQNHLIYVGTAERLPFFATDGRINNDPLPEATVEPELVDGRVDNQEEFAAAIARAILTDSPLPLDLISDVMGGGAAFVASFTDPADATLNRFVVIGSDEAGLRFAGESFQDSGTYNLMLDSEIVLDSTLPDRTVPADAAWLQESTTFAELGVQGVRLEGVGIVRNQVTVPVPAGIELSSDSTMTINWIPSPALDPETTYVGIFINGIPIGTLRPDESLEGLPISVELPIPAQTLNQSPIGTRQQFYQLNFEAFNDFRSDADDCPDQSGAWITVFDNSSFNVGYNTATVPDLHVFPYPFVSRETEENTAIILPDDFNSDDVQNAITMATVLGRYATLDHGLVVTSKSLAEADANLLTDNHLITIGLDQNDSLALAIFENLIDAQAQRNNAAYPASMYAITSPYNEEKQTLLITGDTPSAVGEIVQAFAENIPAVDQPTTSVVVDNNQEIINLNRIEFVPGEDTPRGTPDDIPDDAVVIIITATPQAEPTSIQDALATALVTPGNNIANNPVNDTTEAGDVEGSNTAPISSQLSFIIIIILAALVLPFAFALTRNNS